MALLRAICVLTAAISFYANFVFALTGGVKTRSRAPATWQSSARDPRQLSHFVFDLDGTVFALNSYRLRLGPDPGWRGLIRVSGLPQFIDVPVQDFEGDAGPRVRDLVGSFRGGQFAPSGAIEPVTLSDGQTIYPGYYYIDPVDTMADFRPGESPGQGPVLAAVRKNLRRNTPFLLEGAALMAAVAQPEFRDRASFSFLSMRGNDPTEVEKGIRAFARKLNWDLPEFSAHAVVTLNHPDYAIFDRSKPNYLDALDIDLAHRRMVERATPHFLVMIENDREYLRKIEHRFTIYSNRGVGPEPVVPILVNLVEPKVFAQPHGVDWNRSRLESEPEVSRVSIYWPNQIERTDDVARLLSLTLNIPPSKAGKLYRQAQTSLACRNIFAPSGSQP